MLQSIATILKRGALAISRRYEVAGVPVWHFLPTNPEGPQELAKTSAALELVRDADPRRLHRIKNDIWGIWIIGIIGRGEYEPALRLCKLDPPYLLRPATTVEDVAATIVHEATHARLWRYGYDPAIRPRIERLCIEAEIAFASRLLDGTKVIANAEHLLGRLQDAWTDDAVKKATIRRLRELDLPPWLLRWLGKHGRPAA